MVIVEHRRAKTGPDWATPWKARMCFGGMVGGGWCYCGKMKEELWYTRDKKGASIFGIIRDEMVPSLSYGDHQRYRGCGSNGNDSGDREDFK